MVENHYYQNFLLHEKDSMKTDVPFDEGMIYFLNNNFNMFFTMVLMRIANNYDLSNIYPNEKDRKYIQYAHNLMIKYINDGVFAHNMFALLENRYRELSNDDTLRNPRFTRFDSILIMLCQNVKETMKQLRNTNFSEVFRERCEKITTAYGQHTDYKRNIALFTLMFRVIYPRLESYVFHKKLDFFLNICTFLGIDVWEDDKYIDSFKNDSKKIQFMDNSCYKASTSIVAYIGMILYQHIIETLINSNTSSIIHADLLALEITNDPDDTKKINGLIHLTNMISFFTYSDDITDSNLAQHDPHISIGLALEYYHQIDKTFIKNKLRDL